MPKNLADWLSYLESLHPKTIALGLERVEQVRQRLGLQPDFPVITVGGTNGKGSVCAMLEAILHAAGYKVGCYTSPHLLDYNERVRIAKKQAGDAELCASFEEIEQARATRARDCDDGSLIPAFPRRGKESTLPLPPGEGWGEGAPDEIPLTYFEFGTLAAMQLFIERRVDVAILEVGLGGRLDAVNIFEPDVAVVTSVDMDHMDYLGDTLEKIAYEKAGIFRQSRVAVFGERDMPAMVAEEAGRIGAVLWRFGKEFNSSPHQGQWDYRGPQGERLALPIPALRGNFQVNNASAALAALDALKDQLPVSMEAVRRGLVEVTLPGRFQILPGQPQIILDVAHNPQAARSLAQNLAALPPAKTSAVFAMLKDKDIAGVVRALQEQVDVWLVAGLDVPRGLSPAETAHILEEAGVRGEIRVFSTVAEALHQARKESSESDRIAAFGSFYTVAEVMRAYGLRAA